jgi:hypothetical protein
MCWLLASSLVTSTNSSRYCLYIDNLAHRCLNPLREGLESAKTRVEFRGNTSSSGIYTASFHQYHYPHSQTRFSRSFFLTAMRGALLPVEVINVVRICQVRYMNVHGATGCCWGRRLVGRVKRTALWRSRTVVFGIFQRLIEPGQLSLDKAAVSQTARAAYCSIFLLRGYWITLTYSQTGGSVFPLAGTLPLKIYDSSILWWSHDNRLTSLFFTSSYIQAKQQVTS